jgi:hypothetical protein
MLLVIATASYIGMSSWRGSYYFWKWRLINFPSFQIVSAQQEWGVMTTNLGLSGEPLTVNHKTFKSALATHAFSRIRIKFDGDPLSFSGSCGYPDYVSGAGIVCEIVDGNTSLYKSEILNSQSPISPFEIPLNGRREIDLIVRPAQENINGSHAVWLDLSAKL